MLTDLPIGFWTSAFVLDIVGGKRSRPAAELLVGLGVLSALPTAASGAADWSDTDGGSRRVGLVHAAANTSAVVLYAWSWNARRQNRHARGVALGLPRRDRGNGRRLPRRTLARAARYRASTTPLSKPARPTGRRPSTNRVSTRMHAESMPTACRCSCSDEDDQHLRGGGNVSPPWRAARRRYVR